MTTKLIIFKVHFKKWRKKLVLLYVELHERTIINVVKQVYYID